MRAWNVLVARLRALLGLENVIEDIDEELRIHVEMATEANLRRGMSPEEARRAALPDSGTTELAGLAGKMTIHIVEGKHSFDFDYTLAEANR